MATTSRPPARFSLPTRIRTKKNAANESQTRLSLVDRIADLRGIETVERRDDTVPRQIDVYLKRERAYRVQKSLSQPLLCSLNCIGVTVYGLDSWARHQVVARGWGKLVFDEVLVFTPRDSNELDVVWKIFQRAYDKLYVDLANEPGTNIVSTWDWPQFSRTTLQ